MYPLGQYINGNHTVSIFPDGTKIKRAISENTKIFTYDFPESFDFKINDRCSAGCPYCHENSSPNGKCPSLRDFIGTVFFQSIPAYTEIAIGGGNLFESPDIETLLREARTKNIISNITISQKHLPANIEKLEEWKNQSLISGIGISLTDSSSKTDFSLIDRLGKNVVIHVINGILSEDDIPALENRKVLLLGYKFLGRVRQYLSDFSETFFKNSDFLKKNLKAVSKKFEILSFDTLAVKQLSPKENLNMSDEDWKNMFDGDDDLPPDPLGNLPCGTMFVDYPNMQVARSSTSDKRFPLLLDKPIETNFRNTFNADNI